MKRMYSCFKLKMNIRVEVIRRVFENLSECNCSETSVVVVVVNQASVFVQPVKPVEVKSQAKYPCRQSMSFRSDPAPSSRNSWNSSSAAASASASAAAGNPPFSSLSCGRLPAFFPRLVFLKTSLSTISSTSACLLVTPVPVNDDHADGKRAAVAEELPGTGGPIRLSSDCMPCDREGPAATVGSSEEVVVIACARKLGPEEEEEAQTGREELLLFCCPDEGDCIARLRAAASE